MTHLTVTGALEVFWHASVAYSTLPSCELTPTRMFFSADRAGPRHDVVAVGGGVGGCIGGHGDQKRRQLVMLAVG